MIKTISCLIILAASTTGGFIYAEGFRKRAKQLNEFERALNQLQNEIEYTYTPLPEAFESIAGKSEGTVKKIFMQISRLLYDNEVESVYAAFMRVMDLEASSIYLKAEDIKVIMDLAKSLGEADIEGHKKIFSLLRTNLKKQIDIAEEAMKKNIKLYRYLGFSVGAMLAIVLI